MKSAKSPFVQKLWALISRFRRFISFGLVGILNTLITFVVYTLIVLLLPSVDYRIAQAIGHCAGLINSFIMNKQFTFRKGATTGTQAQLVRFILVNAATLLLSVGTIYLLVDILGIDKILAQPLNSIIVMCVNYVTYKLLVFGIKDRHPNGTENGPPEAK